MSVFHRFVRLTHLQRVARVVGWAAACMGLALPVCAQVIDLVWMGGDDCPPCAVWKRQELPRFAATPEGRSIRITGVDKPIRSPVPAAEALPPAARVYKAQLDEASAGRSGSPQMALVVDGKVYDYFFGIRSADLLVEMVQAVRTGSPYPVQRCLRLGQRGHQCDKPA